MFNFKKRTNLPSNFGALAIVPRREKKKQIWEDSITPIQINLLPQNKRLEERSAQHISAVLTWLYHKNLCQARCTAVLQGT